MTECTVYSPCGRYVVRFHADAQHQQLHLDVRSNALHPQGSHTSVASARQSPATQLSTTSSTTTPGIRWGSGNAQPDTTTTAPLHLVAALSESDIVALTTSAGVRKNFVNFSKMLYDALIGRSACVHFYVETVAEMKERIQRDVQQQQQQQEGRCGSPSPTTQKVSMSGVDNASLPAATTNASAPMTTTALAQLTKRQTDPVSKGAEVDRADGICGAHADKPARDRVCTAVGDTVIELDDDIAVEVLEQRFLTVDYDVDFTRALFPIPLAEAAVAASTAAGATSASAHATVAAEKGGPATASATSAPSEVEKRLRQELQSAWERTACLESENAKLRKENAALVQLSKQKMLEMQRLCDDFQQRVHDAAEAEKLRAKNTELRVRLQEAVEERQTALRTLERERSQRRLLAPPSHSSTGVPRVASRTASSSSSHNNPHLRSLSRDSGELIGKSRVPYSRHASLGSNDGARRGRRGEPLLSPTPTPTSRRRVVRASSSSSSQPPRRAPTRFDTPPGPSPTGLHGGRRSGSRTGGATAMRSARREEGDVVVGERGDRSSGSRRPSALNRYADDNVDGGGDGDSPAPRDRTGGRQAAVRKPRRSRSDGAGASGHRLSSRDSSPSLPRRGPSLWADTSDRVSSVASSRCSSASHERLYRATTVSSRQHQTPKAYALEELGARRSVFH